MVEKLEGWTMQNTAKPATRVLIVDDHPVVVVRLPVAVRLRHIDQDRRGRPMPNPVIGPLSAQAGCHGHRYQPARCLRLRADAAHSQGRSGRQDHHVQHERRSGLRGSRGRDGRAGLCLQGRRSADAGEGRSQGGRGRQFHLAATGGSRDVLGRFDQGQSGLANDARASWKSCGCWAAATRSSRSPMPSIFPTRPSPTPPPC